MRKSIRLGLSYAVIDFLGRAADITITALDNLGREINTMFGATDVWLALTGKHPYHGYEVGWTERLAQGAMALFPVKYLANAGKYIGKSAIQGGEYLFNSVAKVFKAPNPNVKPKVLDNAADKASDIVDNTIKRLNCGNKCKPKDVKKGVDDSLNANRMGMKNPDDFNKFAKTKNKVAQTQRKHLKGDSQYKGEGYVDSVADAQKVLTNYKNGKVEYLGTKNIGGIVIRDRSVTGTDVSDGISAKTNIFIINTTQHPNIITTNPTPKPR